MAFGLKASVGSDTGAGNSVALTSGGLVIGAVLILLVLNRNLRTISASASL